MFETQGHDGLFVPNGSVPEYADFEDFDSDGFEGFLFTYNNMSNSTNGTNSSNMYEEYTYDYNTSITYIALQEFVPVLLVYGLTLILGVTGNLLVIFVIAHNKRMQSVTNIFLTSLATADLLLVLMCVPIKVSALTLFPSFNMCVQNCQ